MVRVLKYVRRWGDQIPIYITECGWSNKPDASFNDVERIQFYRNYIGAALYCERLLCVEVFDDCCSVQKRQDESQSFHRLVVDGQFRMESGLHTAFRPVLHKFQVGKELKWKEKKITWDLNAGTCGIRGYFVPFPVTRNVRGYQRRRWASTGQRL